MNLKFKGHSGGVWTLLLSGDGSKAISGSTDRTIRIWDTGTGELIHNLQGHTSTVRCMALHDEM
jgi:F-box/WD-40 domain protein 7